MTEQCLIGLEELQKGCQAWQPGHWQCHGLMADPDRRRLPYSRPGLTGFLDFIAKARFCAFSWSENRTKLELNQNCMDSMTSLQYFNYSACALAYT